MKMVKTKVDSSSDDVECNSSRSSGRSSRYSSSRFELKLRINNELTDVLIDT